MKWLWTLLWKHLVNALNNRLVLLLTVGTPLFIVILIQAAFGRLVWGRGIPDVPVGVGIVNLDQGTSWGNAGQVLVDLLQARKTLRQASSSPSNTEYLPLALFSMHEVSNEQEARSRVARGEWVAAVVVPPNFSTALENEQAVVRTYIYDPYIFRGEAFRNLASTLANLAGTAEIGVSRATSSTSWDPWVSFQLAIGDYKEDLKNLALRAGDLKAYPVGIQHLDNITPLNQVELTRYLAAGIAVLFTGFWGLIGAASLHQEKARGTLQRMFQTPHPPYQIVLGTILGVTLESFLRLLLLVSGIFVAEWLAGLSSAAAALNLPALLLLMASLVGATAGFGVLIAGMARNHTQAANYGRGLLIVMGMVGGVFFPVEATSGPLSILAPLTFHYWALHGYQKLLIGAGIEQILPHLAILAAMGTAFFFAGSYLMRRRLAYA